MPFPDQFQCSDCSSPLSSMQSSATQLWLKQEVPAVFLQDAANSGLNMLLFPQIEREAAALMAGPKKLFGRRFFTAL